MKNLEKYSWPVLRIGLALVYIYFGSQQLIDSSVWEGLIPIWLTEFISAKTVVTLNGIFELVASVILILGFQIRWVALLLALHLFTIVAIVGFNPVGVRDFGLAVSSLALALHGNKKD